MSDKKLERQGLMIGVPGLILQISGTIMVRVGKDSSPVWALIGFIGVILLIIGLGLTAKAKGHSPILGFLGVLGIIGLVILALLSDKHAKKAQEELNVQAAKEPPQLPVTD